MAKTTGAADSALPETDETPAGKGRATPSRKEQEAARRRPLVPADRKEAAKADRAKAAEQREKARIGMLNGDERYLPARDKGPQRKYARDYVDARFSAGELLIPLVVIVIVTSFLPQSIAEIVILAVWAFFVLVVIDSLVLSFLLLRRLRAKFGADKVERGLRWYAITRAAQFRPLRAPKPQVKLGQWPS